MLLYLIHFTISIIFYYIHYIISCYTYTAYYITNACNVMMNTFSLLYTLQSYYAYRMITINKLAVVCEVLINKHNEIKKDWPP